MAIQSVRLIPRNLQFPTARFLTEAEQERYEELCKPFGEKARNTLNVPQNGSNLFKVLLLNQHGIKTATLPELDLIAEIAPDFLTGFYEDAPAVVLRSAGDSHKPNDSLAKSLAELIKATSFSHAYIIEGLIPKEDASSAYGLSFEKGERFKVIKAPAFDHQNNGRKFTRINPDYTVDFDNDGKRIFYTRNSGVSRLYLGRFLNADSDYGNLVDSDGGGLVVCIAD